MAVAILLLPVLSIPVFKRLQVKSDAVCVAMCSGSYVATALVIQWMFREGMLYGVSQYMIVMGGLGLLMAVVVPLMNAARVTEVGLIGIVSGALIVIDLWRSGPAGRLMWLGVFGLLLAALMAGQGRRN